MSNIIRFIIKYNLVFFFLLFEVFSFYLLISYNQHHKETFLKSSGNVTASLLQLSSGFTDYFSLKEANEELSRENAYLRTLLPDNKIDKEIDDIYSIMEDSVEYIYRPAKIINNSVNRLHNYITLNKGERDGINRGDGVISARGVVGVVRYTSQNYSTVLSLLNTQLKISAKLKESNFFGTLEWNGKSYQHAILSEIPAHATVSTGDAVVSSGYSTIFPEGILIGTIQDYELISGEGFYNIRVKLSVDFKNLTYVEAVKKINKKEQLNLENRTLND
ncbi:rod shape-determining protein MreC [Marinilabiliaceae bacterium ANBcel2]|nr:rod shape-determining protein MreC [Marinilabiliaceae bacterium ANBcel2]